MILNDPFEVGLLFNLLRPNSFPKKEEEFSSLFVKNITKPEINLETKNLFQRRILGLVSYYVGSAGARDRFATQQIKIINTNMPLYMERVYEYFESLEEAIEKKKKQIKRSRSKGGSVDMFRAYTRQSCNFVFPYLDKDINGENRPRPAFFRNSEDMTESLLVRYEKLNKKKKTENLEFKLQNKQIKLYYNTIDNWIEMLKEYFHNFHVKDQAKKHTLKDDIELFKKMHSTDGDVNAFMSKAIVEKRIVMTSSGGAKKPKKNKNNEKKQDKNKIETIKETVKENKGESPSELLNPDTSRSDKDSKTGKATIKISSLLKEMWSCSPKFVNIILRILISPGNVIVYSNYVRMEGLEIFKVYLEVFGFVNYFDKQPNNGMAYGEYHGGISDKDKKENMKTVFNSSENARGDIVKVFLISPSGSEGITVNNVRQIHIVEPHWQEVRVEQVIGRGNRQCSHKDLPMKERHLIVYRYHMRRESERPTTDQEIYDIAMRKQKLINTFLRAIKEASIDCELFKEHNKAGEIEDLDCFKFNEEALIGEELGYGYYDRLYEDLNKGESYEDYEKMEIEVIEINAVTRNTTGKVSSTPKKYWYNPITGHVYDYDLYHLIGKVKIDESKIPEMYDKNTYILNYLIPIPKLKKNE